MANSIVPESIITYIKNALDKKYPAIVIRSALKKSGHPDTIISQAFAEVKKIREPEAVLQRTSSMPSVKSVQKIPKVKGPEIKKEEPKVFVSGLGKVSELGELDLLELEPSEDKLDLPPPPEKFDEIMQNDFSQPALPNIAQQKKKMQVRHIIIASLFLIAVILLMYATLSPLLLNVG